MAEKEYIEREAIKSKKIYSEERHEYVVPVAEIDWMISADVAPVKHGHWKNDGVLEVCSVCKSPTIQPHINMQPQHKYCPNCGCKMDGETKMNTKPIVINFLGEPSTGKSTATTYIFSQLKMKGINCEFVTDDYIDGFSNGVSAVMKEIETMTNKDVVKIVRCKDCKYKVEEYGNFLTCNVFCNSNELPFRINPNDYCSRGEKCNS